MTMLINLLYLLKKLPFLSLKRVYFFIGILLLTVLGYHMIPLKAPLFDNDYSHVVLDKNKSILRVYLNQKEQRIFPPDIQPTIPERLMKSIIMFEDRYFYYHPGVNPVSIWKAWRRNVQEGRVVAGGSTLTMQLARLSHPKPRTYFNKLVELLQAFKIEWQYSKYEILSSYITHAPFGGNIQGFYAASLLYFSKKPSDLTWGEAAMLAVLPNSPRTVSPVKNHDVLIKKQQGLLQKLLKFNVITQDEFDFALKEPIPNKITSFPFYAPHFSDFVKRTYSSEFLHHTTLDKDLQIGVKDIVKRVSSQLSNKGIHNVAVLVADTQTGSILAYIGSQDYFDRIHSGSVDGVHAWRSSGSTLKPFLYALAIDEGIALPDTKLFDIPTNINGFTPANATEDYYGVVSMKQSLIESLNVPATRVLNTVGVDRFYLFLKSAGATTLFRQSEDYGLSLILGGSETTVWDLTSFYRGLGTGGQFSTLSVHKTQADQQHVSQLISPGASYLTLNILKDLVRPGTEYFWDIYSNQWPLAWKTGTSYGQRDAWAVGVSPQYTIGVWVGNFSGAGNSNLSGAKSAGPLLFDVFNYLPKSQHMRWFSEPADQLSVLTTCSETGLVAGAYCEKKEGKQVPIGMRSLMVCPYHQRLHLNKQGTYQVCSKCWNLDDVQTDVRLIYPPHVRKVLAENGAILPRVPVHNPSHSGYHYHDIMTWIYPKETSKIWIPRGIDGSYQKVSCKLAHNVPKTTVFWYVNDSYVGSTHTYHELPLLFKNGVNTIVAIDEHGHRIHQTFVVAIKER